MSLRLDSRILLFSVIALAPGLSMGQTVPDGSDLGAVLDRAERDARKGRFESAIESYQRAYALSGDPLHHYNVSVIYFEALKDPLAAFEFAARFGEEARSKADFRDATAWLAKVERRLARSHGKVVIDVEPSSATIWLDRQAGGRKMDRPAFWLAPGEHWMSVEAEGFEPHEERVIVEKGKTLEVFLALDLRRPTVRILCLAAGCTIRWDGESVKNPDKARTVEAGTHRLNAQAEGMESYETEVSLQPGESRTIRVPMEPLPAIPAEPVVREPAPDDPYRPWAWSALAGGSSFVVAGTVLYVLARRELDFQTGDVSVEEHDRRVDRGKAMGYSSYAFWGFGAAALTAGLVLYFTGEGEATTTVHPVAGDAPGIAATFRF